jgi:hypothetical protein
MLLLPPLLLLLMLLDVKINVADGDVAVASSAAAIDVAGCKD